MHVFPKYSKFHVLRSRINRYIKLMILGIFAAYKYFQGAIHVLRSFIDNVK